MPRPYGNQPCNHACNHVHWAPSSGTTNRSQPGAPFWQRNYWEHIIRNDASLDRIRAYIRHNPARWAEDRLHPDEAHWYR